MSNETSRANALYAFAIELQHDQRTLDHYIKLYPELKSDLLDLAWELQISKDDIESAPETIEDPRRQAAWSQFTAAAPNQSALSSPFAKFRGQEFVTFANSLRLPRSIVVALRDRLVEPASIPASLVEAISDLSDATNEAVQLYFAQSPTSLATMEFKANKKPVEIERTTFEKLVESTELTEDQRDAVMEYVGDGQSD